MTQVQRVIKYLAIAFAIFLIFNIVYAVIFGIQSVFCIFTDNEDETITELHDLSIPNDSLVSNLDIDLAYTSLIVNVGDEFKIETNQDTILCRQERNTILIEEDDDFGFLKRNKDSQLLITVPKEFVFEKVEIDTGAGKISIEELNTNKLSFDFGAGKTEIEELNVLKDAELDGGAGEIKILSGEIHNLDVDMGVGKFILKSSLIGNHQIDAGVGEMNLELLGEVDDYAIKVDKGIGSVSIDGKKIENGFKYGDGDNFIDINGGVGTISVDIISIN